MSNKLNIAFFWHMHQPLYKAPDTGEYILPWVLLHATKDYYDMGAILDEFPAIRQTFNFVPSLIEQIKDYESESVVDLTREVSKKPAGELGIEDKRFILDRFFQANWHTMIKPFPRYWELLNKRGFSNSPQETEAAVRYFAEQDYTDLQVLFNLAWIDPQTIREDKDLSLLRDKGGWFSDEEKRVVLDKQLSIVRRVIPKYRELAERGAVELTTSPYYHPIMPLLCDSDSAKEAIHDIALPRERFQHVEDAREQLRRGIK